MSPKQIIEKTLLGTCNCTHFFLISEPNKKKKCFETNKWDKTKPGKSPVKWNFANMDFECVRDYLGEFKQDDKTVALSDL